MTCPRCGSEIKGTRCACGVSLLYDQMTFIGYDSYLQRRAFDQELSVLLNARTEEDDVNLKKTNNSNEDNPNNEINELDSKLASNKQTIASSHKRSKGTKTVVLVAIFVVLIAAAILKISPALHELKPDSNDVWGWGPERETFTMDKPADYVTFNSITDNGGLGDERNFVRIRKAGETTFTDNVEIYDADADNGQEFEVYIFFHNNAASNYNLTAENTKVYAYFPGIVLGNSTVDTGAKISASNAKPTSVWDAADFINQSSTDVRLKYVEDSATIYWNGGKTTAKIGEDLFSTGALIGYCPEGETNGVLNGEVPGCEEYSGYIIYKIKAEQNN